MMKQEAGASNLNIMVIPILSEHNVMMFSAFPLFSCGSPIIDLHRHYIKCKTIVQGWYNRKIEQNNNIFTKNINKTKKTVRIENLSWMIIFPRYWCYVIRFDKNLYGFIQQNIPKRHTLNNSTKARVIANQTLSKSNIMGTSQNL